MKEKKINYGFIVFVGIIVLLFIPIIVDYVKSKNIELITSTDIGSKMEAGESFLVYFGDIDKSLKKDLRKMREKNRNEYSYEYGVYYVSSTDKVNDSFEGKIALLIVEGDIQKEYTKYDISSIEKDVETYLVNDITDKNRSYKVFENYKAYKEAIKSKDVNMIVFGRDNCSYCNLYKPVYNAVADKYNLNIYYFDSNNYDAKEYNKVINYDLEVPAKCGNTGSNFKLSDGFGTPLTIFTKNGKIIDCLGGYVNRNKLISQLKNVKMISE